MNWGYKIMIVYLVFVAGIAVMVYNSAMQNIDLVTPDYYAKELKYQEKIDETNVTKKKTKRHKPTTQKEETVQKISTCC